MTSSIFPQNRYIVLRPDGVVAEGEAPLSIDDAARIWLSVARDDGSEWEGTRVYRLKLRFRTDMEDIMDATEEARARAFVWWTNDAREDSDLPPMFEAYEDDWADLQQEWRDEAAHQASYARP